MKKKQKMTAVGLARRIRNGIKKLGLKLKHRGYYDDLDGSVCAIGGALAYAAKSKEELKAIVVGIKVAKPSFAAAAAKILNHGLTPGDMVMLETGYENYPSSPYAEDKDATGGFKIKIPRENRNPYYKLGAKLRAESTGLSKRA